MERMSLESGWGSPIVLTAVGDSIGYCQYQTSEAEGEVDLSEKGRFF